MSDSEPDWKTEMENHASRGSGDSTTSWWSRAETVALLVTLATNFAWRARWIRTEPINPDETFFAGSAFRVARGMAPHLDFSEAKSVPILKLYSWILTALPEGTD